MQLKSFGWEAFGFIGQKSEENVGTGLVWLSNFPKATYRLTFCIMLHTFTELIVVKYLDYCYVDVAELFSDSRQ